MTIAIEDIPAALVDIHTQLADKLGGQPKVAPSLDVFQSGSWRIALYGPHNYSVISSISSDNPTDTIKQALDFIAGMVSKEEQRVIDWQKDVAKVIDDGYDLNFPENVLRGLRASSQAMTENLLTVQA
tara:strand:+ start:280 stop:663 length:384 start_codon:yes stop_codon:yes gene_type:complete